ncbi:hypothetical protein LTS08_001164 [Lithohypha guttulata]|nr:hypothetical protein LTS08_001164 [Lithohypha guttulata]
MALGSQPPEPEWMALPSGSCCLKGHIHSGKPRGSFDWVADIETYVSRPSPEKANGHIILYFPDVFGFFTNGLLIMDEMADAGYTVIGVDYFKGEPVWLEYLGYKKPKPELSLEAWLPKHVKFANENVPGWVDAVKQKYGKAGTKYACVGYCFGAPYVANCLAPTSSGANPPCDVGAFAHPAFLKEHHFTNLQRPLFLSCAETDFTFSTDARNKAIDILREAKKPYHLQLFSGVEHGFALRCNLDVPYERWCKEQSLRGIVDYFDVNLGVTDEKVKKAQI